MKIDVPGYPCLVVAEHEAAQWLGDPWPPQDELYPYCTCDDWSPEQ